MLFSNYTSHHNDDAKERQSYMTVKFGMILFLASSLLPQTVASSLLNLLP